MCVKFYFTCVCRTHKNFQLFIKLLLNMNIFLKIFFVLFGSFKIAGIFISSMKFSFNYHQQNFIYAFFKKMTVKYLFE